MTRAVSARQASGSLCLHAPSERVVERCRAFTIDHGASAVSFVVGTAEELPFTDGHFDAIVCFDVLEHVADPARAFAEIERVLAPGGRVWLVFPSYLGASRSHPYCVTRLPALHRIFDPSEIIEVVNVFLREQRTRFATLPQPPPRGTALGRLALSGLNGMQWRDVDPILARSGLVRTRTALQGLVTPDTPIPGAPMLSQVTQAVGERLGWPELPIGSIGLCVERDAA